MKEALEKAKNNEPLSLKDLEHVNAGDLTKTDKDGFNLLDWALIHHNYPNILFLTDKYISPESCSVNCFTRLYMGKMGPGMNRNDVTKIAQLLVTKLSRNFDIPSNLKCSDILKEYFTGADEIIAAVRHERRNMDSAYKKTPNKGL